MTTFYVVWNGQALAPLCWVLCHYPRRWWAKGLDHPTTLRRSGEGLGWQIQQLQRHKIMFNSKILVTIMSVKYDHHLKAMSYNVVKERMTKSATPNPNWSGNDIRIQWSYLGSFDTNYTSVEMLKFSKRYFVFLKNKKRQLCEGKIGRGSFVLCNFPTWSLQVLFID